jgi:hypothetical protein
LFAIGAPIAVEEILPGNPPMYPLQRGASAPNFARTERPHERVNENVFKRVVKTLG